MVYEIGDDAKAIQILRVDHRADVYRARYAANESVTVTPLYPPVRRSFPVVASITA